MVRGKVRWFSKMPSLMPRLIWSKMSWWTNRLSKVSGHALFGTVGCSPPSLRPFHRQQLCLLRKIIFDSRQCTTPIFQNFLNFKIFFRSLLDEAVTAIPPSFSHLITNSQFLHLCTVYFGQITILSILFFLSRKSGTSRNGKEKYVSENLENLLVRKWYVFHFVRFVLRALIVLQNEGRSD